MAERATGKEAWVGGSSYARQRPEHTLLYQLIEQHYPAFIAQLAARGRTLPAYAGLLRVGPPHVRPLDGPIWEMRMSGRGGIARALYVAIPERRVVVVRVFVNKPQKTPRREIELARRRAQELLS